MAPPRPLIVAHRWLGVFVGALMTVWCLSGFVMMYMDYPRLTSEAQRAGLAPMVPVEPVALRAVALADDAELSAARLEMLDGRPVLRLVPALEAAPTIPQLRALPATYDLQTGGALPPPDRAGIDRVAADFAARTDLAGSIAVIERTEPDQWTVQTGRHHRPLWRIDFVDAAATSIYVAGSSGEVVQRTSRSQRFWNWLGAVPHWLYPTLLRRNGALWTQVVVWTSLAGTFLAGTGLWLGTTRLRRAREGRSRSPFGGIWWWHHMFGLFFGVLTLTWVASGLLSMNPWGLLGSENAFEERRRVVGTMRWEALRAAIAALPPLPDGTVRIEAAPLGGLLHLVALSADGSARRFDAGGRDAPLNEVAIRAALGRRVAAVERIAGEDAYYYGDVPLPAWRVTLTGGEATQLYLHGKTGAVVRAIDRDGRAFRWLHHGLHSLDVPVLRLEPVRALVVLPLLAGVTLVCATGTWMGFSRIRRDLAGRRRRHAAARSAVAA